MITLFLANISGSFSLEVLGYITSALEVGAALFVIVMKVITIFKAKDLSTKEKLEEMDKASKDIKK